MRLVTRIFLIVAALAGLYSVAIVVALAWPASGWIVLLLGLGLAGRRGSVYLTTLGSARWANIFDLKKAKFLDGKSGLIIGKVKRRFGSDVFIRLTNVVHSVIFAPTGRGKNVSLVIPFLLMCPESCVVVDFKGENYKLTAEHRRKKFGHRIVCMDPFNNVTNKPDTYNPFDFISKDSRVAIDDLKDISKALVVRTGKENERHFDDRAELGITSIGATVVGHGDKEKGTRSFLTVKEIISNPDKLTLATQLMLESDLWEGHLKPMGGEWLQLQDRERASVISTQLRHLSIFGSPTVGDSVRTSSFDPADLRKGKMTIYLIIPPERVKANAGLLRMWVSCLLRACMRGGLER